MSGHEQKKKLKEQEEQNEQDAILSKYSEKQRDAYH